jgi:NAD+ synthase (glutamine-hydrolysing)
MPHTNHTATIKICLAQINLTVGAVANNTTLILDAIAQAANDKADLIVLPELAISGYPPEDLLFRPEFAKQCQAALAHIATTTLKYPDLHVVIGHPDWYPLMPDNPSDFKNCHINNAASLICGGKILGTYYKHELPNYGVFDEHRYFSISGAGGTEYEPFVFDLKGTRFGINICEDVWLPTAPQVAKDAGAQVLLVLNASPFYYGKMIDRINNIQTHVSELGMAYIGVNHVGGQDELIFDGGSFVLDAHGKCTIQLPQFDTAIHSIVLNDGVPQPSKIATAFTQEAEIYQALVLATRDYVYKNGFKAITLGLSGGVDSALVLSIAVDALGADAVYAVMMPTRFTANMSVEDSREMVARLQVPYEEISIEPLFKEYLNTLSTQFSGIPTGLAEENLQARIRGTLLMALSNKFNRLVLTTGNKSETAVGYCTLYGDMCGGFAVLKDVLKTQVYRLCAWRNQQAITQGLPPIIPKNILTRPPSAELREHQTDQDSLPDYAVLDAIIQAHLEQNLSFSDLLPLNLTDEQTLKRVLRLIQINEYKRRQSAVGAKITPRSFGKDWRLPITNGFVAGNLTIA